MLDLPVDFERETDGRVVASLVKEEEELEPGKELSRFHGCLP